MKHTAATRNYAQHQINAALNQRTYVNYIDSHNQSDDDGQRKLTQRVKFARIDNHLFVQPARYIVCYNQMFDGYFVTVTTTATAKTNKVIVRVVAAD